MKMADEHAEDPRAKASGLRGFGHHVLLSNSCGRSAKGSTHVSSRSSWSQLQDISPRHESLNTSIIDTAWP